MATVPRFPWLPVTLGASVMVGVGLLVLRLPGPGEEGVALQAALPKLELGSLSPAKTADVMAERLAAYDPTPLFLPTALNSTEAAFPETTRQGADLPFTEIAARLPFARGTANVPFPPPVVVPAGPVEGLKLYAGIGQPLALGQLDYAVSRLPARLGQVEAINAQGAKVAINLDLDAAKAARLPEVDWAPLELTGAVTSAGLVGGLSVTLSSGSEETDAFFIEYLTQTLRLGERLPSGFYTLHVGP
jgi:hypothetical protein